MPKSVSPDRKSPDDDSDTPPTLSESEYKQPAICCSELLSDLSNLLKLTLPCLAVSAMRNRGGMQTLRRMGAFILFIEVVKYLVEKFVEKKDSPLQRHTFLPAPASPVPGSPAPATRPTHTRSRSAPW